MNVIFQDFSFSGCVGTLILGTFIAIENKQYTNTITITKVDLLL